MGYKILQSWKVIYFYNEISIHVLAGFANKSFLFATFSQKIKSIKRLNNIVCLGMFITYTFYFFKNQIILAQP